MSAECDPIRNALYLDVHRFIVSRSQLRAMQIAWALGLPQADQEDIAQDVVTQVWISLQAFDNTRSSVRTFASRVVDNKSATIIRSYRARRRTGKVVSLEDVLGSEAASRDGFQLCCKPHPYVSTLCIDVARTLARLTPNLRKTAWSLAGQSRAEAARELSISRAAIHRRLEKIRQVFLEGSLDEYVRRPSSKPTPQSKAGAQAGLSRLALDNFPAERRTDLAVFAYIDDRGSVRQASAKPTLRKIPSKSNADVPASVLADCEASPAAPSSRTKEAAYAARGC